MPVHLILAASMQGWWTHIVGEPYLFCEELPCKDLIHIRLAAFFPIYFIFNHSLLLHAGAEILSDASEQSARAEIRLGVPFCCCRYQHFIHANPDVGSSVK